MEGAEFLKDQAEKAYENLSPKVVEGAEYLTDKAGEAYDALKPKVVEGAEFVKEKAEDALKTGSKSSLSLLRHTERLRLGKLAGEYAEVGE